MPRSCTASLGPVLLGLGLALGTPGQAPTFATATTAMADAAATEPGGSLLAIPGIGDDFVLFGDGQLVTRTDGTARLSAFVHRALAIDREFYVQLEFSGRVAPGDLGYPPPSSPTLTLLPSAYVPNGTIDPATYVFYTQVTGSLTGVRTYGGALLTVSNQGPAQLGLGASNKNVENGLATDLAVTVVQQPTQLTLVPTGPAQVRATVAANTPFCAAHIDADPAISSGPARVCLSLPGVANDYVFQPVGTWTEAPNGTATLAGTVRRQSDYSDQWTMSLTLSGRVDPGSPAHPPANCPVTLLLPAAYTSQGGPIDPAAWHYYTQVTGSLTGAGINDGGSIQLSPQRAVQVGLGAGHGNLFPGLAATLNAASVIQPTARTITITGALELQSNVTLRCLLPLPQVLTGIVQTLPTVTEQKAIYTGIDLGWTALAAIGPRLLDTDPRRWFEGNVRVVDHNTVEVSIPQGMAPASYPARLFTVGGLSNALTLNLVAPATITLRTEDTRTTGEIQHWVVHQGGLQSLAYTFLFLSDSNLPSAAPGLLSLDIGNQFSNYILFGGTLHDAATGVGTIPMGPLQPGLAGLRLYAQAAVWDLANLNLFPLVSSDVWFTDYQ